MFKSIFCFQATILLNILAKGAKPEITEGLTDLKVTEEKDMRLQVFFASKEDCKVCWFKNGETVASSDHVILKDRKDGCSLVIRSVNLEDSGKYSCEVSNEFGVAVSSCEVDVEEIKESPAFISKLQVVQVSEGKAAEFQVKVKGAPQPTIEWYKDDKKIEGQERYKVIDVEKNSSKLVIENCRISDKGRIKCVAKNIVGEKSCWADLLIQQKIGPPRIDVIGELEREVDGEKDILLEADVTGKPRAKVEWSKNGKPLVWNTRKCELKAAGDRHTLKLIRATEKEVGEYKLIATSSAGKEMVTFVVKKKG